MDKQSNNRIYLIICLLLVVGTMAVYWPSLSGEFLMYDDEQYITENPMVPKGLTAEAVAWAFRLEGYAANWHPLTWLSHMLDVELFGMKPMGHHLMNVLIHVLSTLLLFAVFTRMTGAVWNNAFVAALFAIHPLHVESVAWAAERKDTLSTMFWMLTMLAYVYYVEKPGALRYATVLVCFTLGLMAKPMLVTLPFALLLLDYWPLGRLRAGSPKKPAVGWSKLFAEKTPLLALAAASSTLTFIVQRNSGAVNELDQLTLGIRIGNAIVSYAMYIWKMIWPSGLIIPYQHPGEELSGLSVVVGLLALAAITTLVIRMRRHAQYLAIGWLWYLGTLVPMIGLVQVGDQAMADRYTYIPLTGLFVMIAWGMPVLFSGREAVDQGRKKSKREIQPHQSPQPWWKLGIPAGIAIAALMVTCTMQTGHWHDTVSLFEHTLSVEPDNYVAHNNLGQALNRQNKHAEAAEHYAAAVDIRPGWAEGYNNLAVALSAMGRTDEAIENFQIALRLKDEQLNGETDHNMAIIHNSLGLAYIEKGMIDEAIAQFSAAVEANPNFAQAYYGLGRAFETKRDYPAAIDSYRRAVELSPNNVPARNNLAVVLYYNGNYAEAWQAVADCRSIGHELPPDFIQALSREMPEPGR